MTTHASLLLFGVAFALAALFPGPVQTAIVARVLAKGRRGIGWYIAGIVIGNACWLCLAALGLTAIAARFAMLFTIIKWLGLTYLVFIGCMLWLQKVDEADASGTRPEDPVRIAGFGSALALSLGNPKALIFFGAILPQFFDLASVNLTGLAGIVVLQVSIDASVQCIYVFFASRLRRAISTTRQLRLVRRVAGTMMLGVAATMAARS